MKNSIESFERLEVNFIADTKYIHNIVVFRTGGSEMSGEICACIGTKENSSSEYCTLQIVMVDIERMTLTSLRCDDLWYALTICDYPKQSFCTHIFMTVNFKDSFQRVIEFEDVLLKHA